MPVKNAEKYLNECLDSILKQSFSNWELLVVDDHSEDDSYQIIKSYCERDSRIQLFKNPGKGIIEALRLAYSKSSAPLIHRMDADDIMPKDKLTKLLRVWEIDGKGSIATGKVNYFSKKGISEGYQKYEAWLNGLVDSNQHWNAIYRECVIASPLWLIHREDLDNCHAFQSNFYPEDYDLVFRFYEKKLKVNSSPEVLHLWRDHEKRTSRTDQRYSDSSFYVLKLHYFLKLDHQPNKSLFIWGAGTKGKTLAKLLQKNGMDFTWVSNNPKKQNITIYEELLLSYRELILEKKPQILIAITQRNAKTEITSFLSKLQLKENSDFYFF